MNLLSPALNSISPRWLARAAALAVLLATLAVIVSALTNRAPNPKYDPADVARAMPLEVGPGQAAARLPAEQNLAGGQIPRAILSEDYFDFGPLGSSAVVEREFVLRNQGTGDLIIQRAYTTCGCTIANLSSTIIPPGKLAVIRLRFDAGYHNAAGTTVRRGLILETNDPRQRIHEIWVQAEIRN